MKKKVINRTKEQILADQEKEKRLAEIKEQTRKHRLFIKETFYPFLLENSKDIKDVLASLQYISAELNTAFQERMIAEQKKLSDAMLKDLELVKRKFFSDNLANENFARDSRLIELFNDQKINDAHALISGMVNELKMFLDRENSGRPLHTLKAEFLDEQSVPKEKSE